MRYTKLAAFGVLMATTGGAVTASDVPVPSTSTTPSALSRDAYRLGPGDRLHVTVYNEPSLTGEYAITSAGQVSMPLIGNVAASDLSLAALEEALTKRYATFVKEPRISVEQVSYRPFYILGEVNKPGEYPFRVGMKLEQAIASAGGYTYRANRGTINLRRAEDEHEERIRVRKTLVPVMPGDTIRVGERFF